MALSSVVTATLMSKHQCSMILLPRVFGFTTLTFLRLVVASRAAAFLTGLYPHQNGQIGLATWKFQMYREDTPNMVRSLKQAGYRTGIVGKLHVNPASAFPFDIKKSNVLEF